MTWPMIAGLGSSHGDDQAGWLVLERLQALGYPSSHLLNLSHPARLLDKLLPDQSLVICDACMAGKTVGSVHRLDWPAHDLTYERGCGSHDLALPEILELGRQIDCVPASVTVWAISGDHWIAGSEPTAPVRAAAILVGDTIWESCRNA